ncbi:MAG: RyR domain-containing protein, partial [Candidatus Methanomethylophilaceae archaeon]
PESIRYSNIRQAMNIPKKLEAIGCYIGDGTDAEIVEQFTAEEAEILSMKEHELWVEEREENGWTYGAKKDVDKLTSPYIAPWEDIPDDIKRYDFETTDNIIKLVRSIGMEVCRPKRKEIVLKDFKFDRDVNAPIILSVSGHADVAPGYREDIVRHTQSLVKAFRTRYPDVEIILMTGLGEGADRIVAKAVMELGVHIAPVLPKPIECFKKSFSGKGYDDVDGSIEDFESLLNDDLCYSPCVLCDEKTNPDKAYRVQSAYMVKNSHLLIAVWDGRRYGVKGGTYDCVRMAVNGIDPDLTGRINPMTSVSSNPAMNPTRFLDAFETIPVYWIEAERECGTDVLLDKMCRDPNREVGRFCGYIWEGRPKIAESRLERIKGRLYDRGFGRPHDTGCVFDGVLRIDDKDVSGSVSSAIPGNIDVSFKRISVFNRDLNVTGPASDGDITGLLSSDDPDTQTVKGSGCMKEMSKRFDIVSRTSERFRISSKRKTIVLIAVSALCSLFFYYMMLFSGSILLSMLYMLLNIAATILLTIHTGTNEHRRFVEYHAVSESIRVQFYWSILGINEDVSSNFSGYQKNDMIWAGTILKGYSSYFMNDYSAVNKMDVDTRIGCCRQSWICSQKKAHEDDSARKGIVDMVFGRVLNTFNTLSLLLSAISVIIALFIMEHFDDSLFSVSEIMIRDTIVAPYTEIDGYMLIKLTMVLVTVIINSALSARNMIFKESDGRVSARGRMYDIALNKLDIRTKTTKGKIVQAKLNIFYELGVQMINDSNDWVIEILGKDFKAQKGMMNLDDDDRDRNGSPGSE